MRKGSPCTPSKKAESDFLFGGTSFKKFPQTPSRAFNAFLGLDQSGMLLRCSLIQGKRGSACGQTEQYCRKNSGAAETLNSLRREKTPCLFRCTSV